MRAREHDFFAACMPGLETFCARELKEIQASAVRVCQGGVEFKGKLDVMYEANLMLRCANRVWMRVAEFRAGALEEIFRKVRALRWETLVWPKTSLMVHMTLRRARISHSGKAAKAVEEAIRARFIETGFERPGFKGPSLELADDKCDQKILVHLEKSRCRISLDSSGEHLHRRGYRLETAKAPLRETLAAGVIMASGWNPHFPFLDPMCGSGTFPIEAALMACRIPPGLNRTFAFMNWPSFGKARWEYLKKTARNNISEDAPAPIWGMDRNAGAIRISQANAQRAGVREVVRFEKKDFLQEETAERIDRPGFLFLNTPYGRRVRRQSGDRVYYAGLGKHLKRFYGGWKAVVLVPQGKGIKALGMEPSVLLNLDHGGIKISAVYLEL